MNDSLCGGAGRFVTLLLAVLDRNAPRLALVNAGHVAPLRRRPSGLVEVIGQAQRGVALGILPGQDYHELQLEVEPGEMWFVCTDGFTEAASPQGEMYGLDRLRRQLAPQPDGLREAGERIVRDVGRFVGQQPQGDDMCLVGWGRLQGPPPPQSATSQRPTLRVGPSA
jgi:serine phosphatase RsbU (regulator of sigma subunit)